MLKVAFIGCGRIADLHILGYRNNPNARVVAIATSPEDKDLGERRKREWNIDRVVTNWRLLAEDPEIDMVEILTPHHLHPLMTIEFLRAGKHVSLQKPVSNTLEEACLIEESAQKASSQLRIYENYRFFPPVVKAKEIIDSGELGEFIQLKTHFYGGVGGWEVPSDSWKWRHNPQTGGGGSLVFDHGFHVYSLAQYFGGEIEKVFAWIGESHQAYEEGFYDSPVMTMWKYKGEGKRYGSWQTANTAIDFNSKYYGSNDPIEIVCEKGIIYIPNFSSRMIQTAPLRILYADGTEKHFHHLRNDWADSFIDCTNHFIDSLLNNQQADLDIQTAISIQKTAEAVLRSSQQSKEIFIDDLD